MNVNTLTTYGGPYTDRRPVINPTTEVAASKLNRALEDTAQLTATGLRAIVQFTTTATAAPVTYAAASVSYQSLWGSSDSVKPTVAKTSTGVYTVTFASTYTDGLSESESVALLFAHATVKSATLYPPPQITALTSTVVTVTCMSTAFVANDLGGTGVVTVWCR